MTDITEAVQIALASTIPPAEGGSAEAACAVPEDPTAAKRQDFEARWQETRSRLAREFGVLPPRGPYRGEFGDVVPEMAMSGLHDEDETREMG